MTKTETAAKLFVDGKDSAQIAAEMNTSVPAINNLLWIAMNKGIIPKVARPRTRWSKKKTDSERMLEFPDKDVEVERCHCGLSLPCHHSEAAFTHYIRRGSGVAMDDTDEEFLSKADCDMINAACDRFMKSRGIREDFNFGRNVVSYT